MTPSSQGKEQSPIPGRFSLAYVALEGDRQARLVRSMWLEPADARAMACETAELAPALELSEPAPVIVSTLPPPMVYGAQTTDQAATVLVALAAGHVTAPAVSRATKLAEWRCRQVLEQLGRDGRATRVNGSTWALV